MICKLTILYFAFVWAIAESHKNHNLITRTSFSGVEGSRLGIYCGNRTIIEYHPYQVAIYKDGLYICSGSIVSQSWVVTLGDCANGYAPSRLRITAGSIDGFLGRNYDVKQVVIHPQYGNNLFDYDYACLQADGLFQWSQKVQPIPLAYSDPAVNSNLVVSGWGVKSRIRDVGKGEPNFIMMEGTMSWLSQSNCTNFYSGFGFAWTNRMACTYNKGCTTPCLGDWGDPYVQNGVFYGMFIAIASYRSCTPDAYPAIVAVVSPAAPWISGVTGAQIQRV